MAVGIDFATGSNARVFVRHTGKPVVIKMVAIDKDLNEVPVKAMPPNVIASGNIKARSVFVQYPKDTYAICGKVTPVNKVDGSAGVGLAYRACTALSTARGGSRRGPTVDNLDQRLKDALKPNANTSITIN